MSPWEVVAARKARNQQRALTRSSRKKRRRVRPARACLRLPSGGERRSSRSKDMDAARKFRVAQVFRGAGAPCVGLSFHGGGRWCVAATGDGVVRVLDGLRGVLRKEVRCAARGVGAACFGHAELCVVVADAAPGTGVRYLSLHDNRYLRAFEGHAAPVCGLAPSPASDAFFSLGEDGTCVLWDAAQRRAAVARLDVFAADASRRPRHAPVAAFARDALVFAAGAAFADARGGGALALYDARHYRAGPFATFRVDRGALAAVAAPEAAARAARGRWARLEFAPVWKSNFGRPTPCNLSHWLISTQVRARRRDAAGRRRGGRPHAAGRVRGRRARGVRRAAVCGRRRARGGGGGRVRAGRRRGPRRRRRRRPARVGPGGAAAAVRGAARGPRRPRGANRVLAALRRRRDRVCQHGALACRRVREI